MNADGIIDALGDKIKQLVISEAILKEQMEEMQKEIERLNSVIQEKEKLVADLQNRQCECGGDRHCNDEQPQQF